MSLRDALLSPKTVVLAVVSLGVIALDQYSKALVLKHFQPGESIPLISGYLSLTYVKNTGAAFGMLASADPSLRGPLFVLIPLVALLAIGWVFRKLPHLEPGMPAALAMVAGGAVGNLLDRLFRGFVVDFFDFHWHYESHFPAFNVADTAITLGVIWMLLDMLFDREDATAPSSV